MIDDDDDDDDDDDGDDDDDDDDDDVDDEDDADDDDDYDDDDDDDDDDCHVENFQLSVYDDCREIKNFKCLPMTDVEKSEILNIWYVCDEENVAIHAKFMIFS